MSAATTAPERNAESALLEVAYHHEPYWGPGQGDWIKSLLLFFDGVALLVPDYMRDRPLLTDPTLAQPLADQGLLHRLSPETLVDQTTAETLTDLLDRLLNAGTFDDLDRDTAFAELSYSRLGGLADAGLTEIVLEQLRDRGLARPSEDGVSIPLHPAVRTFVLVVLPQLLRAVLRLRRPATRCSRRAPSADPAGAAGHAQPRRTTDGRPCRRGRPRTGHPQLGAGPARRGSRLPPAVRRRAPRLRAGPATVRARPRHPRPAGEGASVQRPPRGARRHSRPIATAGTKVVAASVGDLRPRHRRRRRGPCNRQSHQRRPQRSRSAARLRRQADPASAYTYLFRAERQLSRPTAMA